MSKKQVLEYVAFAHTTERYRLALATAEEIALMAVNIYSNMVLTYPKCDIQLLNHAELLATKSVEHWEAMIAYPTSQDVTAKDLEKGDTPDVNVYGAVTD